MAVILTFPPRPKPVEGEAVACIGNTVVIRFPGAEPALPSTPAPARPAKCKRGGSSKDEQRKGLLAKIHIALGELYKKLEHFDRAFYEDELDRRFNLTERGKEKSAAELAMHELEEVKLWLTSLGWQAKKGRHRKEAPRALTHDATGMSRGARLEKIEAMLAEKGRVEGTDVPWGYAVAILKRQTANDPAGQVRSFDKASPRQLDDVIAALYRDARRKGRRRR